MSKFKQLFEAARTDSQEPLDQPEQVQSPQASTPKAPARLRGKRSDPAYEQVTAYIRKDTYRNAKIALLQESQGREFSELVEALLFQWIATRS